MFTHAHCGLCLASVGLTCKSWQAGTLYTTAPYAAYTSSEVKGTVGLYMGLSSFNVTLEGDPIFQNTTVHSDKLEQIDYNEEVPFGERQGRGGYGPYANRVNQVYREN